MNVIKQCPIEHNCIFCNISYNNHTTTPDNEDQTIVNEIRKTCYENNTLDNNFLNELIQCYNANKKPEDGIYFYFKIVLIIRLT